MSLWEKLAIVKTDGRGVWDRVASDLQEPASLAVGMGVWAQVGYYPAGFWDQLGDETVVLPGEMDDTDDDLWQEVNDETLMLERSHPRDVWGATGDQVSVDRIQNGEDVALWERLGEETLLVNRSEDTLWTAPKIRDATNYKPKRALGWALKGLTTAQGEPYWVLKNLRHGTYLRLNELQIYWWDLLDGEHSIQDLAVATFLKYQTLSYEGLMGFLGQLHAKGFLADQGVNVYLATSAQLQRRGLNYWVKRLAALLIGSEYSIQGVDRIYSALYRWGGRLLFTFPIMFVIWTVSIAGLPAFFYLSYYSDLSFVMGSGNSLTLGLIGLWVAQLFAIFAHESAHALTTKHYGRTLRRGGVGLYFGMLVFFMDTTDIWMEPRKPRLAVTWAGPLSGYFLGGLASLALLAFPTGPWAGPAYQFIVFCLGISTLNLNPLLKLDGYYILMDWLEMPMLRERALNFVQGDLWRKLFRREPFEKEERIFTVFGLLSLVWTAFVLYSLTRLVGDVTLATFQNLLGPQAGMVATVLLVLVAAGALLWPYLRAFLAGGGFRRLNGLKRLFSGRA